MSDGSINTQRKVNGTKVSASGEYSCEVVTPILQYEDLDDLQNEVAFEIDAQPVTKGNVRRIEKVVGDQDVLLVILDYRSQRSVNETKEERAAAGMLLMNQRRTQLINQYVQDLYDKALKEGKIVQ